MKEENSSKRGRLKRIRPSEDSLDHGRVPPQAIDLEEGVLGAIMLEKDALSEVIGLLKPEIFYKKAHNLIFKAIQILYDKNAPIDILTVTNQLKFIGELESVGGNHYITSLTNRVASSANTEYHTRIIIQKFMQRELIRVCSESIKIAFEDTTDVFDLLEAHEKGFGAIWDPAYMSKRVSTKTISDSYRKLFAKGIKDDELFLENIVLKTGWKIWDQYIETCLNKIVLIAGAAGDGKSKFISSWLFRILKPNPDFVSVKWITLEDSAFDISSYFYSQLSMITIKEIKRRKFNENQRQYLDHLTSIYENFDIEFTEESQKVDVIIKNFERFCTKREGKFNILVIDNILSLKDRSDFGPNLNAMYDYVMNQILYCKQRTRALIIIIHHFKDIQLDPSRLKTAFRPGVSDVKGTEAFRRVPNQMLMINTPRTKKILIDEYFGERKKILQNLMIIDPGKIRDDENTDETSMMYMYAALNYSTFFEIPREIIN